MRTESQTTGGALLVPGQFSLRALFIATLMSAAAFALLAPLVRGWPQNYQLDFLRVATLCIALHAGLYAIQAWRQRKLEHEGGELLAYLPGNSSLAAAVICIAWYVAASAYWLYFLNAAAKEGLAPPNSWDMVVMAAMCNSGSLWAYGSWGIQLRDRGLILYGLRFDWHQITQFMWPNDNKLVLFFADRTTVAIAMSTGARETVEQVLRTKAAFGENHQQEPTVESATKP